MGKRGGRWSLPSRHLLPLLPLLVLSCRGSGAGEGGGETILFASGADLQSINPLLTVHPLARQVQKHVLFLTLASYDSSLTPVPRLGAWEWNGERTRLTFHLRHDVRWHDGVPTTASDVVWTLRHARDPEVAYPRARDLAGVRSVEAPDSFTVVLRFTRSQPTFPDVLTDLAVLPAHAFAGVPAGAVRTAPFNRAPFGNGPFAFREYRPGLRWVFERSPDFPATLGAPAFERFVVAVVDEPTTKLAGLTSGELDFAGINPAHAAFVRDDPRLRVVDYPVLLAYGLVWNLRRPPFDDRAVRRALTMALDRRLIVEAYLYGFGTVADGPVPPDHPWHVSVPPVPYDPAAARAVLAGRGIAFDLLTVGSGDLALEQMIQAQLRAVGVEVRIRRLELSTFLALAQGGARDFDALVTGIPGDLSLGYVAAMFDGDGPLAYPGLTDAALDTAFAAVARAASEEALATAWARVQRRLAERHPVTWIYHARGVQGVSNRIANVRIDLRGELAGITDWQFAAVPPYRPTAGGGGAGR